MGHQFCSIEWVGKDDRDRVIGNRVDVGPIVLYSVKFVYAGHLSVCLRVARGCARRRPRCGGKAGRKATDSEIVRGRVRDYRGGGGIVEVSNLGTVAALGKNEVVQLLVGCEWDHNMLIRSGSWVSVQDHYSGKKDKRESGDDSQRQTEDSSGFGAELHGLDVWGGGA